MVATEYLIDRTEVEKRVGLTRSSIYDAMRKGNFPLPLKVGPKAVRWRTSDIEAWVESRPLATGRRVRQGGNHGLEV